MTLNRRHFVQGSAALAVAGVAPRLAAQSVIKIGYVAPQTGPLAPFGEADKWVIEQMKAAFKDGITVGGKKLPVEIVLKDSQSNPNRAGEVANDLILKDRVALMLTAGASDYGLALDFAVLAAFTAVLVVIGAFMYRRMGY